MKRILSAAVALPILLFTLWSSVPYYFAVLAAIAVIIGLHEFYNLALKVNCQPHSIPGYLAGLCVIAAFVFGKIELIIPVLAALVIVSFALSLLSIMKPDDMKTALASVAATVLSVIYIALLAGFLVGVRMLTDTPQSTRLASKLLTMFFAMVIFTDTGAFYAGRNFGKHKLAPHVSPGKTVEGFVGGLLAAIGAGALCEYTFFPEINLVHALVLGGLIGLIGPVGDLSESLLKRGSDVKDSGAIMPGHGGILDRVDSVLFCAPLLYYYIRLFGSYL